MHVLGISGADGTVCVVEVQEEMTRIFYDPRIVHTITIVYSLMHRTPKCS